MRIGCFGVNIRRERREKGKKGGERKPSARWWSRLWANTRVRRICTIEGERRWGNKVIPAALSRSGARGESL